MKDLRKRIYDYLKYKGGKMKIICSKCNTVYNVPSDKMPKTKIMATCKKCGEHIVIEPGLATPPEPLADPPTSPASHPSPTTAERTREKLV